MVVTFVATVRLYLRRVLCATTRRVTIYLFVHFRLDFSTLYYCASHEEQSIDIYTSLLCTSGGFKEERSSREKNTPSRRGFARILIVKARTRFSSPRARVKEGTACCCHQLKFNAADDVCATTTSGEDYEETRGDDHLRFTPSEWFDGTLVRDSRRGKKNNVLLEA